MAINPSAVGTTEKLTIFLRPFGAYFCVQGANLYYCPKRKTLIDYTSIRARGVTRNRTGDTRIFSPLLYQLSYDTRLIFRFAGAKVGLFRELCNFLSRKCHFHDKKSFFSSVYRKNIVLLQPQTTAVACIRKVAQLVAHYVRDVGVGRSSRLFPTES